MKSMDDIIKDLEADDLLVQQEITTEENITPEEIIQTCESIFQKDINTFKPSFGQYINDLAKANGCPFIFKDSKTKSQLYFKFVCKLSGTSNKYSNNCPSYICFKGRGSAISFERSCWYQENAFKFGVSQ